MTERVLFALPALAGTLLSLTLAWWSWRRRSGLAWAQVSLLGLAVAWWCAAQIGWIVIHHHEFRILSAQLQYAGITTTPVCWVLVALAYTGRRAWVARWRRLLLIPGITFALVLTNPLHHLIWRSFEPLVAGYKAAIAYGPWFWVHTVYSYGLVFLGTTLLAVRFAASPLYRGQLAVVLLGPAIVMFGNLAQITGLSRLPIDPTPLSFALAFAATAWAVRRHRLFELLPLARGVTVDSLQDGVLVVDASGRVVDANPAAASLLARPLEALVGSALADLLPADGALAAEPALELRLDGGRRVEARTTDVTTGGEVHARVLLLRDVTEQREAHERLLQARDELRVLNQELERLAHTDLLTGLANRRRFLDELDREWARARRSGRPLSLCLLDLDHFKRVNDERGHLTGDRVLETVGRELLRLVRPQDLAARYGGEELAVLLPECGIEAASEVATRLATRLRELEHRDEAGAGFRVTVSIGVAAATPGVESTRELVAAADRALYHAKAAGRDRVSRAHGEELGGLAAEGVV